MQCNKWNRVGWKTSNPLKYLLKEDVELLQKSMTPLSAGVLASGPAGVEFNLVPEGLCIVESNKNLSVQFSSYKNESSFNTC